MLKDDNGILFPCVICGLAILVGVISMGAVLGPGVAVIMGLVAIGIGIAVGLGSGRGGGSG